MKGLTAGAPVVPLRCLTSAKMCIRDSYGRAAWVSWGGRAGINCSVAAFFFNPCGTSVSWVKTLQKSAMVSFARRLVSTFAMA